MAPCGKGSQYKLFEAKTKDGQLRTLRRLCLSFSLIRAVVHNWGRWQESHFSLSPFSYSFLYHTLTKESCEWVSEVPLERQLNPFSLSVRKRPNEHRTPHPGLASKCSETEQLKNTRAPEFIQGIIKRKSPIKSLNFVLFLELKNQLL